MNHKPLLIGRRFVSFKDRIGIDMGRALPVEEAVRWAADRGVRYIDLQVDIEPNAMEAFDNARCEGVAALCDDLGVILGLHTLSAVNIAEVSPFLRDAADRYLQAYVDLAQRMRAQWVVVHAGYHFTSDRDLRMQASRERLVRAVDYAAEKDAVLLLENLNWEPDLAEVHYLAHTVDECRFFFDFIDSAHLGWSFTVNHATLVPEGIAGFVDGMPMERCREVRLADNNGEYELHMYPGEGIIDFTDMFRRIEGAGFSGHYMNAFGSLDDRNRARDYLARCAG